MASLFDDEPYLEQSTPTRINPVDRPRRNRKMRETRFKIGDHVESKLGARHHGIVNRIFGTKTPLYQFTADDGLSHVIAEPHARRFDSDIP